MFSLFSAKKNVLFECVDNPILTSELYFVCLSCKFIQRSSYILVHFVMNSVSVCLRIRLYTIVWTFVVLSRTNIGHESRSDIDRYKNRFTLNTRDIDIDIDLDFIPNPSISHALNPILRVCFARF
jgi:hypothetical protein